MKGVTFGNLHSFDDFNLVLSSKTIGVPAPKIITVPIDGADGEIDLTDYFGEPKYNNRTLEFEFQSIVPMRDFINLFSELNNAIHGRKMKIVLDDDPDFYYVGRCSVSNWKSEGRIFKITVTCDCEPYKYKIYKTFKTNTVAAGQVVTYSNSRKSVTPKITSDSAVSFTFKNSTYSIEAAGTYTFPDLVFKSGANQIIFGGAATVTVEYQEGDL